MDSQFNTLVQSYHDNYVQYAVNGDQKYQTAYKKAEEGIQNIIQTLEDQVKATDKNIQESLGEASMDQYKKKQDLLKDIGIHIHEEQDKLKTAQMRTPIPPPVPSYTSKYITVIALLGVIVVLRLL
jgi:hypothetical protein